MEESKYETGEKGIEAHAYVAWPTPPKYSEKVIGDEGGTRSGTDMAGRGSCVGSDVEEK